MVTGKVPTDGRAFWADAFVTIPEKWSQDSTTGTHYLQGADVDENPGGTGGSDNHLHSDSHTHTLSTHAHSLTISGSSSGTVSMAAYSKGFAAERILHNHFGSTSASASITQVSSSNNTSTSSAHPPFFTCIVIKPLDEFQEFPEKSIIWTNATSAPSGWSIADGSGATPNLDGDFIQATLAGDNGGDTGGGTTHLHTYSHTHTLGFHSHNNSNFGNSNTLSGYIGKGVRKGSAVITWQVHHQARFIVGVTSTINNSSPTITVATSLPLFKYLLVIQNTLGSGSVPQDAIIPYTGTITSVPNEDGWYYCDGTNNTEDLRNYQIRCTKSSGNVGTTGGSSTHDHPVGSHSHTGVSHTHSYTFVNTGRFTADGSGLTILVAAGSHTHTSNTMGSTNAGTNSQSSSTDSTDVRQKYTKFIFIQYTGKIATVHIKGSEIKGGTIL